PQITYGRRRRFSPGGYATNRFRQGVYRGMGRRTGFRQGYRNIGSAGAGSYGSVARYDRIPSYRQHPLKGAVSASIMNDHRDVAYHVKQSFRNGLRAGRGGGRSFGRFRFGRSRFRNRRFGGGY